MKKAVVKISETKKNNNSKKSTKEKITK